MKRLNQAARSLRSDGDERSMDQLRADVFLDLGTGGTAKRKPGLEVASPSDLVRRLGVAIADMLHQRRYVHFIGAKHSHRPGVRR